MSPDSSDQYPEPKPGPMPDRLRTLLEATCLACFFTLAGFSHGTAVQVTVAVVGIVVVLVLVADAVIQWRRSRHRPDPRHRL